MRPATQADLPNRPRPTAPAAGPGRLEPPSHHPLRYHRAGDASHIATGCDRRCDEDGGRRNHRLHHPPTRPVHLPTTLRPARDPTPGSSRRAHGAGGGDYLPPTTACRPNHLPQCAHWAVAGGWRLRSPGLDRDEVLRRRVIADLSQGRTPRQISGHRAGEVRTFARKREFNTSPWSGDAGNRTPVRQQCNRTSPGAVC